MYPDCHDVHLGLLKMNHRLTRLTDSARKKKTAQYFTKAQAEAVVIKFASLCNTATTLRRVMNARTCDFLEKMVLS